jgi:hypothetical protein
MLPFDDLSDRISQACSRMGRPVVWLIDEVDRASDYDVFAALLGLLREKYLARKAAGAATFHSVVLAGVHDIKNLKRRIRSDSEHAYNSPWNIAVPFTLDLSFTVAQIAALLRDYDADHGTGMDTCLVAGAVHHATNGYPFLVSRLCEILHNERFGWQHDGVGRAVDVLLHEDSTLFDDLAKNLGRNDGLSSLVEAILVRGEDIAFNRLDPAIALGAMYGILAERDGLTVVSNRIFESLIYGYLVSTSRTTGLIAANHDDRGVFIRDGRLDMAAVITRFSDFLVSEYRHADGPFIESHLRLIFLSWLTPIINGSGHYYVEAETRQNRRMDLVVVYNGIEHIIELKIWSGPADHYRAYEQVADYLDIRGQLEGWLITVTDQTTVPATGITAVNHRGHRLWDAIVAYAQPPGARKPA